MKTNSQHALAAAVAICLSGCSLFSTKSDVGPKDVVQGKPAQVRYTGVEKIKSVPSSVLEPTTDSQYVLQMRKPTYPPLKETVARAVPAPAPAPAPAPQEIKSPVANTVEHGTIQVLFHFDSDKLTLEAQRRLDDKLSALKSAGEIEIVGHTDSRGPDSYNMMLSVRRGEAVRRYLERQGIAAAKMHIRGDGERHPESSNESGVGRAHNRRVVITY